VVQLLHKYTFSLYLEDLMNVVVMGAQWGDEGKGKIVDFLAQDAKYVVRFAGGANAGHTIVVDGKKYALHQVPSGILYPDKSVFLGSGMVIDPEALFKELQMLKDNGISWEGRVFISNRAHVVLPGYRQMDKDRDAARKRPIGTTGRGIGTTYSQKSERDGIRLADLDWKEKMDDLEQSDKDFLAPYMNNLLSMRVDIAAKMWEYRNENILFEGAQGAMLDLDSGTYPYVSSGASCSAGASSGAGIGPRALDKIYGVFKAYETRVGNGPMPTEFNDTSEGELCNYVRTTGNEFGVTTGRPRRCGYLDLVALRYACHVNSIDSLVLTHLDIYDEMDEIEACVAYDINGKIVTDFPAGIPELNAAKPVLEKFAGWKSDLRKCGSYVKLPKNAKKYIEYIEAFTDTPVGIVSVGADRKETYLRTKPWKK
jgi:adenylosuccinate synthase